MPLIIKDKQTNEIAAIFLLQDFPYHLCKNDSLSFIQSSNWYTWLKFHFEDPGPACHSLWLCSWLINTEKYLFSNTVKKSLFQSIFISYPRIDSVLAYTYSGASPATNPKDIGFESLHRVQSKVMQQSV